MKIPRRIRRVAVFTAAFVVGLWIAGRFMDAQAATQHMETQSTTQSTAAPSTQITIEPAAQALVDKVTAAYSRLPLSVEGTLVIDFDVADMKQMRTSRLAGSALNETRFKHEIEGEVQLVVDGESSNVLDVKQSQYLTRKLDKSAKVDLDELVVAMLREQNPALLLAVMNGSMPSLFAGGEEVTLDAASSSNEYEVLLATDKQASTRYFVEKSTGLISRVEIDFRPMLEKQGASHVNRAQATINYTKTDFAPTLDANAFDFRPPADAIEAPKPQGKDLLGAAGEPERLVGKPAPAFELANLDGTMVSLESLKGKVVVLDFWATWCGPCRATLPLLGSVAKEQSARDVVVLAVNVGEDAGTVTSFLKEQKLGLTALLDKDSDVSKRYSANAIPQTVVIGRDGLVRHVSVGATSDYQAELVRQIDAALK